MDFQNQPFSIREGLVSLLGTGILHRISEQTIQCEVVLCLDTAFNAAMPEEPADTDNMEKNVRNGNRYSGVKNIITRLRHRNYMGVLNRKKRKKHPVSKYTHVICVWAFGNYTMLYGTRTAVS